MSIIEQMQLRVFEVELEMLEDCRFTMSTTIQYSGVWQIAMADFQIRLHRFLLKSAHGRANHRPI